MKKLFLMLLAIALVGSFAFAEVTGVEAPTLSGEVTTTFGYDLDLDASGFKNSASVNVTVPLSAGGDSNSGSGDAYAVIEIVDANITVSEDDGLEIAPDLDISAKIVLGDLYVGLGNASTKFNHVDRDSDVQMDDYDDDDTPDVNGYIFGNDGMSIGYETEAFSVEVGVSSKLDAYESDSAYVALEDDTKTWLDSNTSDADSDDAIVPNTGHDYVFGANGTVMGDLLSWNFAYDADLEMMGFGATLGYTAGPLAITVPVDYVKFGDEFGLEIMPAIDFTVEGVAVIGVSALYAMYDVAALAYDDDAEVEVVLTQAMMDELTAVATVSLTALTADEMGWNVNLDLAYDLGAAVPYAKFDYGSNEDMDLSVGSTFPTMVDNAVLKVDYTNGHLLDTDSADAKKGVVTVSATVSF